MTCDTRTREHATPPEGRNAVWRIEEAIRAAAARPLESAIALPPEAFTDAAFYDHEVRTYLRTDWMCLAHVSQVPEIGDYLNLDLFGEPLSVVHGKDDEIRVLSRVCPHRAMDIMPPGDESPTAGNRRIFVCPYHRWTFELDGQAKGCPEMQAAEGFDRRDWGLHVHRSGVWNGFIFVNLSADAPALHDRYAALDRHLNQWELSRMRLVIQTQWEAQANWKVILENWVESYHHLGVHYQTLNPMMPAQGTWVEAWHPDYLRAHLPFKASIADGIRAESPEIVPPEGFLEIPGLADDERTEWHIYLGFPCFMLLTARDRVIWYRIQPEGVDRCRWLTTVLVTPESTGLPDFPHRRRTEAAALRDFHVEDMQVVDAVQKGLASGRARQGRLSHLEEPVWLLQRHFATRGGVWKRDGESPQDPVPAHAECTSGDTQ